MSAAKHTPGPWTHEGQGDITGIEDNGHGRGTVDVCSVYLRTVEGRHEANARLIAAAPELLKALFELLAMCQRQTNFNDDGDMFERAAEAIAKATGEQA